jgi:hypothetical protein
MKRNIADKIEALLLQFPVVAIIGARQVGKTTLAKQLRPNWHYVDMQKPSDFERILFDPEIFFDNYPDATIIDEAQVYPKLFNVLRGVIDNNRQQKGRYIITGSSSPDLLKNTSESLAGRIAILELGTLKANEIQGNSLSDFYTLFTDKINNLSNFKITTPAIDKTVIKNAWLNGGYPDVVLSSSDLERQNWFEFYEKTYLYRDVSSIFPGIKQENFQRFFRFLANLSGTIVNKSQFARDIEISQATVKNYMQIAEGTFLWRNVNSYESNQYKSLVKMPKGYLADTGLLHYLTTINSFDDLINNPMIGRSFEGFVINEIIKALQSLQIGGWQSYHYRTKHGAEIDLVLEGKFGCIPIEIKYGVKVDYRQLKTLIDFVDTNNLPFGILINQAQEITWLTKKIIQIPVWYI